MKMLKKKLLEYENNYLVRDQRFFSSRQKSDIDFSGKKCINFSSNDYLGLAVNEKVKRAFIQGVEKYGVGSSSSASVAGACQEQQILEARFSEFLGRESSLLFTSGYLANIGVMSVLANRHSSIISDRHCHASLLDGIQLSRAKHYRFHHNQLLDLEERLKQIEGDKLIVTESVFGMTGDISPLKKIAILAKKYSADLFVDDAHGVGIFGRNGKGGCDFLGLSAQEVKCLVSPLGKSFGVMGAIISGDQLLITALKQFAKTYRYTTALPPAIILSLLTSLDIVQKEQWRRKKLHQLIDFFDVESKKRGLVFFSMASVPVRCLMMPSNQHCVQMQETLLKKGFFVACIREPSVPKGTSRIKITFNIHHSENNIKQLLDAIEETNAFLYKGLNELAH